MTLENRAREDLLVHYDLLNSRAEGLASRLRREMLLVDDEAELDFVKGRLHEVETLIAGNQEKAALVRSKIG